MKKTIAAVATAAAILSGCASNPDSIRGQYVSPMMYANYDCDQIRAENSRVTNRVLELTATQRRRATTDAVAFTAGMLLFAPALLFMMNGDDKDELGRLKGEWEAIQQAGVQKQCNLPDLQREAQAASASR